MNKKIVTTLLLFALTIGAYADEGMWLPLLLKRLNQTDLQKEGLQLTAEEIYSVNHSSLKDAVVSFGGFCSGEMISAKGLLLTNHHCGYSAIQSHSSQDKNYLRDGFWAATKEDELPSKNIYARFLVRMEDVTDEVLAELNGFMSEQERADAVSRVSKDIARRIKGDSHYDVVVKDFFEGNEFYVFVYETFTDVRLVGAPPESIGKYGGEAESWMWPRHAGDFALFRVYSAPDGKPAPYSPNNIPLKPKHHLPISLNGIQEGDFAMVIGYPGSTDRFLTSYGVRQLLKQSNPTRIKIRGKRLNILKEDMEANEEVRFKYASKYSGISNYWQYFVGQNLGLNNLKVLEKRQNLENEFLAWISEDKKRSADYGQALSLIKQSYDESYRINLSYLYLSEAALGIEIIRFANNFRGLETALELDIKDPERIKGLVESLKENVTIHFRNYNAPTDQKVMAALLEMYYHEVPKEDHPGVFKLVEEKYKKDFDAWASTVFSQSIFAKEELVRDFLNNPDLPSLQNDPAYIASTSIIDNYYRNISPRLKEINALRDKGNRLFVKGLMEMHPEKKYYPNANTTMRVSFGKVLGYQAHDGVKFDYYTSLDGVIKKRDSSKQDLQVPAKLLERYQKKDFGSYENHNGEVIVGFVTSNDITGGSSGSPVLDGKGRLVGTVFDANWETMSGDIAFEPDLQRSINVDIRYILFIIEKFAGADHLIKEMTLVKDEAKESSIWSKLKRGG